MKKSNKCGRGIFYGLVFAVMCPISSFSQTKGNVTYPGSQFARLTITQIGCEKSSNGYTDEQCKDDVYIKINGQKVWPEGKYQNTILANSYDAVEISYIFHKSKKPIIQLMEYDSVSSDDYLGGSEIIWNHKDYVAANGGRYHDSFEFDPEGEKYTYMRTRFTPSKKPGRKDLCIIDDDNIALF